VDFPVSRQIYGSSPSGYRPLKQALDRVPGEVDRASEPFPLKQDRRIFQADMGYLLENSAPGASRIDSSLTSSHF
jgi:hypothetical protein